MGAASSAARSPPRPRRSTKKPDRGPGPFFGLLARSAVIPAVVLVATNMVMVMFIPVLHMVVVGVAGLLAASCAIAMSVIAAR
jgi:hypothetical protein